ncbi:MAG: hypothetical protein J6Q51_00430, partial [Clostridia bacterium]|nr:hypothetical protein [Clostridia bacterium]
YKQLIKIIKENQIDYIHCNTPIGGVLGRLVGKKCKVKKYKKYCKKDGL